MSTRDAGRSFPCECGQKLVVPSLMALKRLEPVPESIGVTTKSSGGPTGNGVARGCIAAGVVLFLLGLVPAVVIQMKYQPHAKPITHETSHAELYLWWKYLEQGIDMPELPRDASESRKQDLWQLLFNGSAALTIVGLGLCVSGIVMGRRRPRGDSSHAAQDRSGKSG
ncbi:MAG: hypothetical protein Q4C47_06485 [Planctomycetia bacterium]|nr:hypothetical protein [Planctomycetia bacterium]